MIRRPPRSTPFPTRRSSDLAGQQEPAWRCAEFLAAEFLSGVPDSSGGSSRGPSDPASAPDAAASQVPEATRSEEHTSELQSLAYLVCRLLLEKKKKARAHPH